jgi:superfamily II DNA or RNA helicase
MADADTNAPRDELARAEAALAELERKTREARAHVQALRARKTAIHESPPPYVTPPSLPTVCDSLTPERIQLFRQLFRGREDVFARLWTNPKKQTTGYAPACGNEWVRGICEKPRVKCGECPNQVFLPVDDKVIRGHLQGQHVLGVYPLLRDETCWFLAVDFDGTGWCDDVAAFVETCTSVGCPAAVERSRSGNGAHAWFFFATPVAASLARNLGSFLLTETMARRHQLSMRSYDRLFPNQDTLPRGGFGNLIALPLQHAATLKGNALFVDTTWTPYPDQWATLASVPRLAPAHVESLVQDAARRGQIMGVRSAGLDDEAEHAAPWTRPPSGTRQAPVIPGPLPPEVRAVLAQRLFVAKAGLPSPLLNQIKRLAAFQNPEFYKKQRMRLSTAGTPRVIACAEEFPEHLALPRGCRPDLEALLQQHGAHLVIDDQRTDGDPLDVRFHGELTRLQEEAACALLRHETGVFVGPPGVGKTVLGVYLAAQRRRSTLVLVHRRPLLDQWRVQLALFLGIEDAAIGEMGRGKQKATGRLDVAMLQSVTRKDRVDDRVAAYGQVIVDECHHMPAVSFERVLSEVRARYVVGLTATPQRRDGHQPITEMQLGPVRYKAAPPGPRSGRPFDTQLITRETQFRLVSEQVPLPIQALYRELAADPARNDLILTDVIRAIDEGHSPILLTERRDHLTFFAERLRGFVQHLVVLQGGMTEKERRASGAALAAIPDDEERLVLATGRYIGEGFDDARLDTLFLALPISWKGTLVQYTGRLHRPHPRKTVVRIFDYVDRAVPMLQKMFERRLRAYRAIGYIEDMGAGGSISSPRGELSEAEPELPSMPEKHR